MHRIAGELYQTEYQNMRENVSPKNVKNAPWLQIAEYLIFCTRDDKDVHNALLTARKMEITNTNTQKYTFSYILHLVHRPCNEKTGFFSLNYFQPPFAPLFPKSIFSGIIFLESNTLPIFGRENFPWTG